MRGAFIITWACSWGLASSASGQMIALEAPLESNGHSFRAGSRFSWGQQALSSVTPSLTVTDGYPGMIFDGQVTPFVTGFVPVVSGNDVVPKPVFESPLRSKIARLQAGEGRSVSKPTRLQPSRAASARATDRSASSAERAAVSLKKIRAANAAARRESENQASQLLEQADLAEQDGRLYAARQLLRRAFSAARAEETTEIAAKIKRLNRLIASERKRSPR